MCHTSREFFSLVNNITLIVVAHDLFHPITYYATALHITNCRENNYKLVCERI